MHFIVMNSFLKKNVLHDDTSTSTYFNNPSYVQLNSLKAFAPKLAHTQLEAINKIKMKIATE